MGNIDLNEARSIAQRAKPQGVVFSGPNHVLTSYFACPDLVLELCSELENQRDVAKEFTVIAGKYETGYGCDENIKFSSAPMSLPDAIKVAKQYNGYPFCYIEFNGERLSI
ncbi:MAG: hypothetical protein GY938_31080 [Ketobacter sp.]|nr:hypothetical protein [Ketobacter sp.]